jgi:competence protein ComGD
MLIVLVLLITVAQISLVYFNDFSRMKQDQNLIEKITNDIMLAQAWAITHESKVELTINKDEHFYTISSGYFNILKRVPFDKEIQFETGTLDLVISYNIKGNIVSGGTFYMKTPKNRYKFVFNLGRGRFYVTRL